jgi:hypothetical protein
VHGQDDRGQGDGRQGPAEGRARRGSAHGGMGDASGTTAGCQLPVLRVTMRPLAMRLRLSQLRILPW